MRQNFKEPLIWLFERNIKFLQELRLEIFEGSDFSEKIRKLKKFDTTKEFQHSYFSLIALNSSILMNSFSYYEGFLESLILDRVKLLYKKDFEDDLILNDFTSKVIKASSIDVLYNYFKKVYGKTFLSVTEEINRLDTFYEIKEFYFIRHILAHGSVEPHIFESHEEFGLISYHASMERIGNLLKKKYGMSSKLTIDHFLSFKVPIDDYVADKFDFCKKIKEHLLKLQLIERVKPAIGRSEE